MSFLERAIRRGVSDAVSKAVGNAVQKAVEPKATEYANRAAEQMDRAAKQNAPTAEQTGGMEAAFGNLQRSMENYATQAAKNMKLCPACEKPCTADNTFCPECGARLPEQTVAEGAVCVNCGKQNNVGTKFCAGCGTKLPAAIAEEQAAAARDAAVLTEWDRLLPQFPKWSCSGADFGLEPYDGDYVIFSARFAGDHYAAKQAVGAYRQLLLQNGFRQAGEYPSIEHLYKKIGGLCCHVDTEHCFDGDSDCPSIGFDFREPCGGFDYVKPEPKKKSSFFDLFK